jgi:hypothetical protein
MTTISPDDLASMPRTFAELLRAPSSLADEGFAIEDAWLRVRVASEELLAEMIGACFQQWTAPGWISRDG